MARRANAQSQVHAVKLFFLATVVALMANGAMPVQGQQGDGLNKELQSLAPESCWLYTAWDASHEFRLDSANPAERLWAEPEIRAFLDDMARRLSELPSELAADAPAVKRRALRSVTSAMLESLLKRSGCIYLQRLELAETGGPPHIEGAIWLDVGPSAAQVVLDIFELLGQPIDEQGARRLGAHKFFHVEASRELGLDVWLGSVDSYVVGAVGWEQLAAALDRRETNHVANWLTELLTRRPLKRTTSASYLNVAAIRETFAPMEGAEFNEALKVLGLDQLAAIESLTGFSPTEAVSRISFRLSGPPRGIFALSGDQGISARDVGQIPADALFAFSASLDAIKLLALIEDFAKRGESDTFEGMVSFMEEFRRQTGVDLERDVLKCLGSTWTLSNGAADGWLTGMILSVEVTDAARLSAAVDRLVAVLQREFGEDQDAPQITRQITGGTSIYTLRVPGVPMPVAPSWCVAEGRLILALFPSSLKPAIGQVEYDPLLNSEQFDSLQQSLGSTNGRLIGLSYADAKRQFELLYPYAQIFVSMGQSMLEELGGPLSPDPSNVVELLQGIEFPPARVIHRHLQPAWTLAWQRDGGIDVETRQTGPSINMAVAAPLGIGLALPAVQRVRAEARRFESLNNMRQIILAAHNFHDTHGMFPAAYSTDGEGRPLLSWRVHLLPYLDKLDLYEQFRLDEPWDSEHNLRLLEQMPRVYQSPSAMVAPGMTVYRAIGGKRGVLIPNERPNNVIGRSVASIIDGTSNTLFMIEVSDGIAVPWTKPDTEIQPDEFDYFSLFGNYPEGTNVVFCDGSARFLPINVSERRLRLLMMCDEGEWVGLDD